MPWSSPPLPLSALRRTRAGRRLAFRPTSTASETSPPPTPRRRSCAHEPDMATELVPLPRILLDRVAALGVDVAALLQRAGLAPSQLAVPCLTVTTREYFAFWRALA